MTPMFHHQFLMLNTVLILLAIVDAEADAHTDY